MRKLAALVVAIPRRASQALQASTPMVRDLAGISGAAMVAHGAGLVYAPAGWIVGGAMVLIGVFLHARGDQPGSAPSTPLESGL